MRPKPASQRRGRQAWLALALLISLQPRPLQPAAAGYLDEVGQMTRVMSDFVDALLEKVSFLAEIIIESALSEQCDFGAPANGADSSQPVCPANSSQAELAAQERRQHQLVRLAMHERGPDGQLAGRYDSREFTNVTAFLARSQALAANNNNNNNETAAQNKQASPGAPTGAQPTPHLGGSCRLFGVALEERDLPVEAMGACCNGFAACYLTCGRPKHDCDSAFYLCLRQTCASRPSVLAPVASLEPLAGLGARPTSSAGPDSLADSKRLRDRYKACKLAAKVLIIGNLAFACHAYKRAQASACCPAS